MPEFRHFAIRDEALELVRKVSEAHELKLIPEERVLEKPQLETFDRYGPRVAKLLREFRVLELEGPFTKHALHFDRRPTGEAAGTYFIDPSVGPRLRWALPGTSDEPAKPRLGPGSLSYARTYLDPSTGEWEPASDELKAAFKAVVKTLKSLMVRVPARKGATVWVGRETKRQIDDGKVAVPW